MKRIATFSAALFLPFIFTAQGAEKTPEAHWPSWRGPQFTGSTNQGTYPSNWSSSDNVLWKIPMPGKGCSTPAVYGEQIIITAPIDGKDSVLCFDFAGKEKWRTTIAAGREGKHRNGSSSNPSPVTNGKHIFAYYKSGTVAGLDITGKLLWQTNLQERFGKDTLFWDIGSSPVLTEKHVVIAVMHASESYLVAFNQASGEIAWKVARNYETPVEGDQSYATPILVKHGDKEAIVVWGAERVTAHDAADGKIIWSCAGFNPQKKVFWVAVASHVIVDDLVIVPYGRGAHLAAVKMGGQGDVTETHRPWTLNNTGAFVPTPAAFDGKLYVVTDRGQVVCIEAKTGKTLWKDDLPKGSPSYYASPVVADGKLYATREDGVIFVASIKDKFELLSENKMDERVIASPVPVANRLLIRGEQHLFCIGK